MGVHPDIFTPSAVRYVSPAMFAPFENFPSVCALARDHDLRLLWCNAEYARLCGRTREAMVGTTMEDIMPAEAARERSEVMREIMRTGKHGMYFQVWKDHRYVTNLWPLDPAAFGSPGVFVVLTKAQPMAGMRPDLTTARFIQTPALDKLDTLSRRELEVLYHLALGMSTQEIANDLHRSAKTIENHIGSIAKKLGFERRTEAVRFAVDRGLLGFAEHEWERIAASKPD